jgi:hypothetical protein
MTKINSFRDLTVWQVSMDLADVCFDIVEAIPNHVSYSLGSHGEVDTLFELIHRRRLVPESLLSRGTILIEPIGKMLHGLGESLELRLNSDNS